MSNKIKYIIVYSLVILLGIIFILLSRCEIFSDKEPYEVIFLPKVIDEENEFWTNLILGAEIASNEYNINLEVLAPETEDDIKAQCRYIKEAISKKPDAIVLSPISYTDMNDEINEIKNNDIKLIFVDSRTSLQVEDCFIGTSNFKMANILGRHINRFLDEESEVAIISHIKSSYTAAERYDGIVLGLAEKSKSIKHTIYNADNYKKSFDMTKKLLEENKNIDVIVGLNLYSLVGAARAVVDLDLSDDIMIFGFDSDIEGVEYLEDWIIDGVIVQRSFNMGYLGIENTYKILNNIEVKKEIDSGAKLIFKNNIYDKDSEKLLFPF